MYIHVQSYGCMYTFDCLNLNLLMLMASKTALVSSPENTETGLDGYLCSHNDVDCPNEVRKKTHQGVVRFRWCKNTDHFTKPARCKQNIERRTQD